MAETVETAIYRLRVEGDEQIKRMTTSLHGMDTAQEDATASNRRLTQQIQRGLAAYDPIIKAQQQYNKQLELNARARESGAASPRELSAHQEAITHNYQRQIAAIHANQNAIVSHTNATKLSRYELINLSRQMQDVGVSLFSGQSPITVAVQQGSQIFDVFASSQAKVGDVFKQMTAGALSLATTLPGIIAGLGAAAAAVALLALQWDKAQKSSERALMGAGARTGTTVGDINRFVDQNSSVGGTNLSQKEARTLGEDLTKTGDITISKLRGMSEAVVGFFRIDQESMSEASKDIVRFASDPRKALDELAKTYGEFEPAVRTAVEALTRAGDKTTAWQVIMDAVAETNRKAAESMDLGAKAARTFGNVMATEVAKPTDMEERLQKLNATIAKTEAAMKGMLVSPEAAADMAKMREEAEKLQQAIDKGNAAKLAGEMNKVAAEAREATAALTPQIEQIKKLEDAIAALERAKAAGVATPADTAALTAAQNQLALLKETQAEAARAAEYVAAISRSWGDVGQATAMALDAAQNQLPVLQAITGAEQMAAQAAADFARYQTEGKSATEATALAASNLAAAQAQANTSVQQATQSMAQSNAVLAAGVGLTGTKRIAAQGLVKEAQAYNNALKAGASTETALAAALEQRRATTLEIADAQAQINRAVMDQIHALEQSSELMVAQANGTEAAVKAAQAYENAIRAGADSMHANALYAATLANELTRASVAMANAENQAFKAEGDARLAAWEKKSYEDTHLSGSYGGIGPMYAMRGRLPALIEADKAKGAVGFAEDAYLRGGLEAAKASIMDPAWAWYGPPGQSVGRQGPGSDGGWPDEDKIAAYDRIIQLQNSQTTDKAVQAANLQEELDFVNALPRTIARDEKIAELTRAIESLVESTDSLNSTNQELLSPYYTQDPRTSHIGFRSQGMATGGEFTVPGGFSANDNMLGTIPLASGEIVSVRRPGESSGESQTIHVHNNISIGAGANVDQFKRTIFQATQNTVRQIRDVS